MKGRCDIAFYAAAFVAGDLAAGGCDFFWPGAGFAPIRAAITIILAILTIAAAVLLTHKRAQIAAIAAFLMLGVANAAIGRYPAEDSPLRQRANTAKAEISAQLADIAGGGSEGAIISAIAIGDRSGLTKDLKSDFRRSGAMHLIALSGLHVGVLYLFLTLTFAVLGNSRPARLMRKLLILALLWTYAFVSGMSNSIMRAAIMITVYEIGEIAGSRRDLLRALAVSALIITLLDPSAPFQIGFQLSFGAMAAIRFIYPPLKSILETRSVIMEKLWNTVALSISCQAATAPLVLLYFGTFPKYFLITNLVAIPITTAGMYIAPLALVTKNLPIAGDFLGGALQATLHLLQSVIAIIAQL
ncbi:MAG: ComEC/Rec2 family competence protein [Bacteroidales bacterium]|nr:ComEC/Rec2 family competence protein [Bacteroidales bacterium]